MLYCLVLQNKRTRLRLAQDSTSYPIKRHGRHGIDLSRHFPFVAFLRSGSRFSSSLANINGRVNMPPLRRAENRGSEENVWWCVLRGGVVFSSFFLLYCVCFLVYPSRLRVSCVFSVHPFQPKVADIAKEKLVGPANCWTSLKKLCWGERASDIGPSSKFGPADKMRTFSSNGRFMTDPCGTTIWRTVSKADDATVGCLEEWKMFYLRTLHVHYVDRVVVRLQLRVSLELWIWILVQRVDECNVNSLSSSMLIASTKHKASLFGGVSELRTRHGRAPFRSLSRKLFAGRSSAELHLSNDLLWL